LATAVNSTHQAGGEKDGLGTVGESVYRLQAQVFAIRSIEQTQFTYGTGKLGVNTY
jgi:hypothetical protein